MGLKRKGKRRGRQRAHAYAFPTYYLSLASDEDVYFTTAGCLMVLVAPRGTGRTCTCSYVYIQREELLVLRIYKRSFLVQLYLPNCRIGVHFLCYMSWVCGVPQTLVAMGRASFGGTSRRAVFLSLSLSTSMIIDLLWFEFMAKGTRVVR